MLTMDKLLLIDDEADVQYSFRRIFRSTEIELFTAGSGEEGLELVEAHSPDLVLMDVRMGSGMNGLETLRKMRERWPKLLVIIMTAYGATQTAIEAMKLGAYDYLLKPFDVPKLKAIVLNALKAAKDMRQTHSYQPLLEDADYEQGVIGRSEAMQNVFKIIGQLSNSDATALITGESGTGKELVARAIHRHSIRSANPFIAINCAAIPENLLESELFGHEKGAFTGATSQRIGTFEQCDKGAIFLDEIGDMSLPTQTKILRALQSGTFERVGGNQSVQVDVQVIAATNKPLEEAVRNREFREDLFYRLNVVRIPIPPLRERREDIPLLVNYFLKKYSSKEGEIKTISPDAELALEQYKWPGNVRELENVIQRAMVVAKGEAVVVNDLPPEVTGGLLANRGLISQSSPDALSYNDDEGEGVLDSGANANQNTSATSPGSGGFDAVGANISTIGRALFAWARRDPKLKVLPAVERELITQALAETKGNQVQASKLLGITRATLRKRIEKFGIQQELRIN